MAVTSVRPDAGDAASWLARRLSKRWLSALHVVYTTIAAQYFRDTTRAAIAEHLQEAGMAASADAPHLHLSMEADGGEPGAGLTATLWSGGSAASLARPRTLSLGLDRMVSGGFGGGILSSPRELTGCFLSGQYDLLTFPALRRGYKLPDI